MTYENLVNDTEKELEKISKFVNREIPLKELNDEAKTGKFNKHFAGDMKYLLQKGIQSSRGNAWKEFAELNELSSYTQQLMSE